MKDEKPKTCRDKKYLEFVRRWLCCCICGEQPAYPHHVGSHRGVALKPSDREIVSLCFNHHEEAHRIGRLSFEEKYGFELDEIAPALYTKYCELKKKGLVR